MKDGFSDKSNTTLGRAIDAGKDFVEHFAKAAIAQPVISIEQIYGEITNRPQVNKSDLQAAQSSNVDESAAARAGDIAGHAIPMIAAAYILRKFAPLASEGRLTKFAAGSAFGASYSALFDPVADNTENFWQSKLKNSLESGLTVGSMSTLRGAAIGNSMLENVARGTLNGFKTGIVGGVVNSESRALLFDHKFASTQDLTRNALTFGLTGAAFSGLGKSVSETWRLTQPKDYIFTNAGTNKMSSENKVEKIEPMISHDPDTGEIMVFDNDRRASFKDGQWHAGALFKGDTLMEFFRDIRDPEKIAKIMTEAEKALKESESRPNK
jgi:hypothetical protein